MPALFSGLCVFLLSFFLVYGLKKIPIHIQSNIATDPDLLIYINFALIYGAALHPDHT